VGTKRLTLSEFSIGLPEQHEERNVNYSVVESTIDEPADRQRED
jgi:hypothetical protein